MLLVILFIGNSLTAANDLPRLLEAMGKASGVTIRCTIVAKPDFSLEDHWNDGAARAAIARGGWSRVILQQGPSALPESRLLLNDFTVRFDREIRRVHSTPGLFAVWPAAARRGDFDAVNASYVGAAALVSGEVYRVGDAWRAAWREDPDLQLYGPDGFHPSPLGSYLAALVIFRGLTGRLPATMTVEGISPRQMNLLRAAASSAPR